MKRRDFVKLSAAGLLALAMPFTFPQTATVQTTLESMGFTKSYDLLKVQIGSFKGSDLKRSFEVNQGYHNKNGWLRLMKYTEGRQANICGKDYGWLVEWRPYEKHPVYKCSKFDIFTNSELDLIKCLKENEWGMV
jgi:hypothetical protein